jgi:outer membrane protein OmpA-like peptidoglycan-associated protein
MTMAIDLVDLVKGYLTPDVVQQAATHVGETSGATQKALAAIVPTLIGGLTNMASTNVGAEQLVRMLDAGSYDGSILNSNGVKSLFGGGAPMQSALSAGKSILDSLFGAKVGSVGDLIARFAGLRPGSTSSLLALAAPLVLHVLGRQRASIAPGASSLASLLGEQKSFLAGMMPAGLSSVLGWSGLTSETSALGASAAGAASRVTREVAQAPQSASRSSWVVPLIILGAIVVGALAWLNRPMTPTAPMREAARTMSEVQLPGGVRISVPAGSFNFSLANWLASTTDITVPKRFVFDDLNFETGSTRLTPESVATVNSLVAVLKAYPAVSVALQGHTDNTGDPIANKKLSLDRAVAVKDVMVQGGVAEPRIATAGYGQESPVAANDTEQGRAKNRRLELVVLGR